MQSLEVKFKQILRNAKGGGKLLGKTDIEALRRGDQTGLDTLVVHAVNDEC